MNDVLLGLDVGGGGVRCLALRAETREKAFAVRSWSRDTVLPIEGFGYDIDLTQVWRQIVLVIREALGALQALPEEVAAVASSSIRHSIVALDEGGCVLFGSPNLDARAISQSMALTSEHGDRLYALTGRRPLPNMLGTKLRWLAETSAETFQRVRLVMPISDWVAYRMSGVARAELSHAAESLLLDIASKRWSTECGAMLGISLECLPELVQSGIQIGTVLPAVAKDIGVRAGTPVVAAGADTQTALLALGAVHPGDLALIGGTTAPIQRVMDRMMIDDKQRLWTGLHAAPGLYILESNAGNMGNALSWMASILYTDHVDPVAALVADAERVDASGVISTLGANVWNAASLGLPVEHLTFSTTNKSSTESDRAQFGRAILEGMAFAVRANEEQITDVAGASGRQLLVGGNLGRSRFWTEAICQVTGMEVSVRASGEATALGAALCAGVGVSLFADLEEVARVTATEVRVHQPEPEIQRAYVERFDAWMALRNSRGEADLLAAEMLMPFQSRPQPSSQDTRKPDRAFRPRIYVAADCGADALTALQELGDVTYASYRQGQVLVGADLVEALQGYQVFVTEVDLVDAEALRQLPDLRLVAVCRGNPTNVDVAACSAAGVLVVHTPGRNAEAVADLTIALMLMMLRKLPAATRFLREPGGEAGDMGRMGQAYFNFQGRELWHKKIGVIGGGAVGRLVVKRLLPFGVSVLLHDPFISEEQVVLMGATKVSLDALLAQSDVITLHAPVNDETRGLIGGAAFAQMQDGVFLVNTARAALVDTGALLEALESGKLGGVALDVFDIEPPGSDDPLLVFDNVIATPHIGGDTFEVGIHQGMMVAAALQQLLGGETPEHLLNPTALANFLWTGPRAVRDDRLLQLAKAPGPSVSDLDQASQIPHQGGVNPDSQSRNRRGGFLRRLLGRGGADQVSSVVDSQDGTRASSELTTPAGEIEPAVGSSVSDRYMQLIVRFLDLLKRDEGLIAGAAGKDVIFLYTLTDAEQSFFMSFVDGVVDAGFGAPQQEPHVRLKMTAATFDGIMLGSINGMQAAMSGKLAFSGDTRRAMSMQRFQRGMGGAYRQALEEFGDPGDLTKIGQVETGPSIPASSSPVMAQLQATGASQPTATGDVRDEMLQVVNDLYARGLITATGGNVSARTADNPEEVWITPSAIFKGDLRAGMMVRIDLHGRMVGDSPYAASSERYVHCAIYRDHPEVQAIIHSHAPQATLMALAGMTFDPISTDAAFIGEIPVAPFAMPGSPELAEVVAKAFASGGDGGRVAVFMQNHGLVVAGTSPRRVADITVTIERTAEALLACKMLGVAPPLLPAEVVAELRGMGKMLA